MKRLTAVGASVFGHPVWPQAYGDFVGAADCAAWICNRQAQVDFDPIGVPEGSPAFDFVRRMLARHEGSQRDCGIPVARQDNALAMLTLLHMPVRCIIKPEGGDDDNVVKEVTLMSACCSYYP